ncbi:MAG: hypothetical protein WCN95_08915 [bacterium]
MTTFSWTCYAVLSLSFLLNGRAFGAGAPAENQGSLRNVSAGKVDSYKGSEDASRRIYEADLLRWPKEYRDELKTLESLFKSAGNLDGAAAVQAEIKRFKVDETIDGGSIVGEPEKLSELQQKYAMAAGDALARHEARVERLKHEVKTGGVKTPGTATETAIPKTLAEAQKSYKAMVANASKNYEIEFDRFSGEYVGELKKYDDWCTREGNSNGGMAVQTAIDRFKKDRLIESGMAMPEAEGLNAIEKKYLPVLKEIEGRRRTQIEPLTKQYIAVLKDLRKRLMAANRAAEVNGIDDEIKVMGEDPAGK